MHPITERTDAPVEGTATSGAASAIPMHKRISRKGEQSPHPLPSSCLTDILTVTSLTVMLHGATPASSQDHSFPPKMTALHALIPLLPPLHAKFFELLDSELEKIDSFYSEREKEMQDRGELLKEQLSELGLHHQKYHVSTV